MDKETLSHYGWIVICILVLSIMIALATPFGTYIKTAVENTTQGLFDVQQKALDAAGLNIPDQTIAGPNESGFSLKFGETYVAVEIPQTVVIFFANGSAKMMSSADGTIEVPATTFEYKENQIIMNDEEPLVLGTVSADGNTIDCTETLGFTLASQEVTLVPDGTYYGNIWMGAYVIMPEIVSNADFYLHGDYLYLYSSTDNGWSVHVATSSNLMNNRINYIIPDYPAVSYTKTSYSSILENINGKPVTEMNYTFRNCTSLTTAPAIPSSITDMYETFQGCTSLTDLSGLVIPSSVTNMYATFRDCTSLTTAPSIPSGVTNMDSTFDECTSLTGVVSIPCSAIVNDFTVRNTSATITYYHIDGCDGSCGH